MSYKEKWISVAVDSIYKSVDENGKNYYFANAMICNLTSDFYSVKFNAVAIIEESGKYAYAKASSATRSIYDVVNSVVLDVYADKIIGSKVAENTKLDYAKWYGTEEYPVAPKTPAQFNKYNELKSTTLKNLFSGGDIVKDSKNNVSGVTVNAKSVQYMYATTDLATSGFDVTVNLDENQ